MAKLVLILISATFFASGCAALIYQLVWQRYLFTGLGVDIDEVKAARYPYQRKYLPAIRRADGSMHGY